MSSAIANGGCKDCQSLNIIVVDHETLCRDCGLVQDFDHLVRDGYSDHTAPDHVPDEPFVAKLCEGLALPDCVKFTATELVGDVFKCGTVRGGRRDLVIAAAVFYAQRVMPRGHRLMHEIVPDEPKYLRECSNVERFIKSSDKWHPVLGKEPPFCFEDYIMRVFRSMDTVIEEHRGQIRKLANRIMAAIRGTDSFVGVRDDNVSLSVIFIAYKIVLPEIKKKTFATLCNISVVTLNKLTTVVHRIMSTIYTR